MITEGEFLLIRNFNAQSSAAADRAQHLINRKNTQLVALADEVDRLRAALRVETGKRRHAELQLQALRRN